MKKFENFKDRFHGWRHANHHVLHHMHKWAHVGYLVTILAENHGAHTIAVGVMLYVGVVGLVAEV
jgi:hypothetical protein